MENGFGIVLFYCKVGAMDDEEYKAIVVSIGEAFRDLPDDQARLDVVASLTGIVKQRLRGQNELLDEWLEQVHATLKACNNIVCNSFPVAKIKY